MKTLRTLVVTAVALTALVGASAANIFLQIEGIPGEAKESKHKDWIEVSSVAGLAAARDAASGQATGRRQYQPIIIRKTIDKSSPLLATALAKKTPIARIVVSQDGARYTLTEVMVSSIVKDGNTESVSFNFTKIEMQAAAPVGSKSPAEKMQPRQPK